MNRPVARTTNDMPVHYIESDQSLHELSLGWLDCTTVAIDTEFMRVRTYYPRAALFQVCDGRACYLIDPLVIEDPSPLRRLLDAPGVTKLMHSCSEDLEVCERWLATLPAPLIDTQIVAAFCGHPLSVGYQKVLDSELGIELGKSETRTDWLQRPLSSAQIRYAAEDVAFLPALWMALSQRLAMNGHGAWARAECSAQLERFAKRNGADYRAVAGAWRLDPRALAVLRALFSWREDLAQQRDLPRSWLVTDSVLLEIARTQPRREEELQAVDGLAGGLRKRHASALLALVEAASSLPCADLPVPLPAPLEPVQMRRVKSLRSRLAERAGEVGVAPEMLARRRDLEELLRWADAPDPAAEPLVLHGWRREVIGDELLALVREAVS